MPVCSLAIRSTLVRGKPQALARAPADILSGTRNSSRRTSPGCKGLSFLAIVASRSEEHTSELQSLTNLVCRLLLEKKKKKQEALVDRAVDQSESQSYYRRESIHA